MDTPATTGTDTIATVLVDRADILERLDRMHAAAWRATDPVLLELCRLRIAMLLDCVAEQRVRTSAAVHAGLDESTVAELASWPSSPRFGARERACLAFCEQFVIDVASMPEDVTADVVRHLGEVGTRTFVTALLVVEQRQRLRLAWDVLLGPAAAS